MVSGRSLRSLLDYRALRSLLDYRALRSLLDYRALRSLLGIVGSRPTTAGYLKQVRTPPGWPDNVGAAR